MSTEVEEEESKEEETETSDLFLHEDDDDEDEDEDESRSWRRWNLTLEMYNFRHIVQAISFRRLFKKVDEPKKALLSFQTTRFKVSKVCYKNISEIELWCQPSQRPSNFL